MTARALTALALACLASGPAQAQALGRTSAPADALPITTEWTALYGVDDYGGDATGQTRSVLWQSALAPAWAAHVGASWRQAPEAEWVTAEIGAAVALAPGTTLLAAATVGPGVIRGASVGYAQWRVEASHRLGDTPLFARAGGQRVDIADVTGNLPFLGLAYASAFPLSGSVTYTRSVEGSVDVAYGLADVRLTRGPFGLMVTAGAGRGGEVLLGELPRGGEGDAFWTAGVGVTWERPRVRLMAVADVFDQEAATRRGVTLLVRIRPGGRE